jgi:hypothetical protein
MKIMPFLLVLIISLFTSCGIPYSEPSDPGYYQFTPNDLSHFYIDKDSLVFTENFYYKDSIIFLLNSKDTLYAEVNTYVHFWQNDNQYLPNNVVGESTIVFNEQIGFRYFYCKVSKNNNGEYSSKYIGVGISNDKQYYECFLNTEPDTATVLDSLYQDVYKLDLTESCICEI